jgi:hypothetical protein
LHGSDLDVQAAGSSTRPHTRPISRSTSSFSAPSSAACAATASRTRVAPSSASSSAWTSSSHPLWSAAALATAPTASEVRGACTDDAQRQRHSGHFGKFGAPRSKMDAPKMERLRERMRERRCGGAGCARSDCERASGSDSNSRLDRRGVLGKRGFQLPDLADEQAATDNVRRRVGAQQLLISGAVGAQERRE